MSHLHRRVLAACSSLGLLVLSIGAVLPGTDASSLTAPDGGQPTVVQVATGGDADRIALWAADLDVVDFGVQAAEVWLHGPGDIAALAGTGLAASVVDTTAEQAAMRALRAQESRAQAEVEAGGSAGSTLPTGRMAYRMIDGINDELQALAAAHPDTAKLIELPHTSLLGRAVYGLEISHDVAVASGEPTFLISGVHHAREWPTAEFVMEFAYDVLEGDGSDARVTELLATTTLLLVPVVNPDGYDVSRRGLHEQKRKNCRVVPGQVPTAAECEAQAAMQSGVDINRNYGTFWNGPGSGPDPTAENHRGEAPYSEPETRNIVELTAAHQVQVAIHNHTPDGRLLRAPSSPEEPVPADEEAYDALAQTLGGILGWPAGPWTEIYYVASGVAEEHAYYTSGIYGFTPENTPGYSGLQRFHPPYQAVVDQYDGVGQYEGSDLREAFLTGWEATRDETQHSVLTGVAPAGTRLRITRDITVETSCILPGTVTLNCPAAPVLGGSLLPTQTAALTLDTGMVVGADGTFEWHVQPSTRPSQRASTHLQEAWLVSCAGVASIPVSIGRGESAQLDLRACTG